jgi:hypothetical protein
LKVAQGLEVCCANGLFPTNVMSLYTNIIDDMPLDFLRNPNVGPRMKHQKTKRIGARSLARNILKVGKHVGALRWD